MIIILLFLRAVVQDSLGQLYQQQSHCVQPQEWTLLSLDVESDPDDV